MSAPTTLAVTPDLTPLAAYLAGVLATVRPLPALDVDLAHSYGHVLAQDVRAPTALPAFDHSSIDGYAARWEDLLSPGAHLPVHLSVVGDIGTSSVRPVRLAPGTCVSVAAGAPLPATADVVIPPALTDQGVAAVAVRERPRRGHGVRRSGDEIRAGAVVASSGERLMPALIAILAATGIGRVAVLASPRVIVLAIGSELVESGRPSQPGQVVDANSHALAAAATEAGGTAYRIGICGDDPEAVRDAISDQIGRADLIVTSGGSGTGPGDVLRRALAGRVSFTEVSAFPCTTLGFGRLGPSQDKEIPVICLPGDPGSAIVGFEILARPVIFRLAGDGAVFRPAVRAHLLEEVTSPLGFREFRPARLSERRGGGYTARPLAGGPYTLSGMASANGLIVLGEGVGICAPGSTVDVLMLDRRR